MFGLVETLIGYMQRQIGKRGDAASDTGSLHAKVSDVKNTVTSSRDTITNTVQKPRGIKPIGSYITSSETYVTALNISGKGSLRMLRLLKGERPDNGFRLTIDGVEFARGEIGTTTGNQYMRQDGTLDSINFIDIKFKSSLKIETYAGSSSYNWKIEWLYELE